MKGLLKKTVDGLQAAMGSSHKIVQRAAHDGGGGRPRQQLRRARGKELGPVRVHRTRIGAGQRGDAERGVRSNLRSAESIAV